MVAGCLAVPGVFQGDDLWPAREANPKGFFESRAVNEINGELVATVSPRSLPGLFGVLTPLRTTPQQSWLAEVPLGREIAATDAVRARVDYLVRRQPFAFKDPRFCYTLPVWHEACPSALNIVVFRDPRQTATSIVKEVRRERYLTTVWMTPSRALRIWTLMYAHVLDHRRRFGDWLFLHADQVLDGSGLDRLEDALGATVDRSFPEASLQRTRPSIEDVPPATAAVHDELRRLAGVR